MPNVRDKASVSFAANLSRSSDNIGAVEVIVFSHINTIVSEARPLCSLLSPHTWSLPRIHVFLGDDETGNLREHRLS